MRFFVVCDAQNRIKKLLDEVDLAKKTEDTVTEKTDNEPQAEVQS